ncbi:hypothetical protein IFM89_034232 [Coptis chinensis]|uniref:Uncharacterized protein n=1 Tax=Coptis chinensis TaxID=261450 RepID=A0A835LH68_9MAGN|nr:hypothetical protein IFM89_034232 [Coptis chinensis]
MHRMMKTYKRYVTNQTFVESCIQEQYLVEEAMMMYCMEYIHDGNLGSHKNGRRVIMNEDIESAHPMDKKGKQYVLPNVEYQQVCKDLSKDNWHVVLDAPKRLGQEIDAYEDPLVFEARTSANDSLSTTLLEDILEVVED